MSSILTNNGAMVALQTLKNTNSNMSMVQREIATGKSIGSAKDNAAVWAISKVMEADVTGFKAISDSLALGESTVGVARNATETVTELLTEIKDKVVAAQEDNVDRAKLQTDIEALREQIKTVVGSAQFNGLNLVNGSQKDAGTSGAPGIDVLSSLDRSGTGEVTTNNISVETVNLSTDAGTADDVFVSAVVAAGATSADTADLEFQTTAAATGGANAVTYSEANAIGTVTEANLVAGDVFTATINDVDITYTVQEGDDAAAIVGGLGSAISNRGFDVTVAAGATGLNFTNNSADDLTIGLTVDRDRGALADLETMDVTNDVNGAQALKDVENMIQRSIDTAASFGSAEKRIEIQSNFVGKLMDSMKSGIGSLVDADMEEASARLQALQVQQQLGIQALSMANQAPQSLLSLFR
jgi:flagellin